MLQQILAVARAIFHLAHHADEIGMQSVDAQVDAGSFAGSMILPQSGGVLWPPLPRYGPGVCVRRLPVGAEPGGYLAAYGIEARQHNSLGGVVDNDFDACGGFESANVATFAAYDAAFDFVAVNMEHCH